MNTKERILQEALTLFARNGYAGVSVRDIAGKLGMQPSALYKHYRNKEALFQSIVDRMNAAFDEKMHALSMPEGSMSETAAGYGAVSPDTLGHIGEALFRYWIQDPYASAFRRMLILEQYRNPDMAALNQRYLASGTIAYLTDLFAEMVRQGHLRPVDPQLLALAFFGPISLLLSIADGTADLEAAVELVRRHIQQFTLEYGR